VGAQLGQEPVTQLVEGLPADPAWPWQVDREVDGDPSLAQHQYPVGQ